MGRKFAEIRIRDWMQQANLETEFTYIYASHLADG